MFPYMRMSLLRLKPIDPESFYKRPGFKYSRMYIQLHPCVSMKSDQNRIAVYHLWGYTYDLGKILWKLMCMIKCSRSTVI